MLSRNWYLIDQYSSGRYTIVSRHWTKSGAKFFRWLMPYSDLKIEYKKGQTK